MIIKRALISVSDRTGLVSFVEKLIELGVSCYCTRGTGNYLTSNGLDVCSIDSYAKDGGFLGGRVKTLSFLLHCAIAARRDNADDLSSLAELGISPLDMVVCNFYPLDSDSDSDSVSESASNTISALNADSGSELTLEVDVDSGCERLLSQVDIGGPAMVRSGARNFQNVVTVVCPSLYDDLIFELRASGCTLSSETRVGLARLAFQVTSLYDETIVEALNQKMESVVQSEVVSESHPLRPLDGEGQILGEEQCFGEQSPVADLLVPGFLKEEVEAGRFLVRKLRHGENPQQRGAYLVRNPKEGFGKFVQLQGKELSYNNLADASAAFDIVSSFQSPAVVVVKHSIPCGVSVGDILEDSFIKALYGDFQSAFGGIIGLNSVCSLECAKLLIDSKLFIEVIVATGFEAGALELLKKKKNLRLLEVPISTDVEIKSGSNLNSRSYTEGVPCSEAGSCTSPFLPHIKAIGGGYLLQDNLAFEEIDFIAAGSVPIDMADCNDLFLAFKVVSFVKSNGIVIVKNGSVAGIGSGQASRVDSVSIALGKATDKADMSLMASDGFIPFADSIALAKAAGVKGIIQPGGSRRDKEVTAASDAAGIYMIHTGCRLFSH